MEKTRDILEQLLKGQISIQDAENELKAIRVDIIDEFVRIDSQRDLRTGIPEMIYAEGKITSDIAAISMNLAERKDFSIITRVKKDQVTIIEKHIDNRFELEYNERARIIILKKKDFTFKKTGGLIGIITAGTSDIPVAEEAKTIAQAMGCSTLTAYDVGVAGLHRVFPPLSEMQKADVDCIIVVAGMEGTLAGIVASLTDVPVIGVPRSIGYGFGERGISALSTMLNSCSPLVTVNIDNGFGAGVIASKIANRVARFRERNKKMS
ncbi:MAG: nickel pincer cofactor biosynthesis protein LarB [Promethearchaeota archaeon]|nr:MAG: nickel pincer cofactor biosynthesis protein LarB [Candidatus Lokiarchaeota archaeon]